MRKQRANKKLIKIAHLFFFLCVSLTIKTSLLSPFKGERRKRRRENINALRCYMKHVFHRSEGVGERNTKGVWKRKKERIYDTVLK